MNNPNEHPEPVFRDEPYTPGVTGNPYAFHDYMDYEEEEEDPEMMDATCSHCHGTGHSWDRVLPCAYCDGAGYRRW